MFRWTTKIDGGFKRVNQAVVHVPGSPFVLSFGGFCSYFDQLPCFDIHSFDMRSLTWREIKATDQSESSVAPPKRFAHTATVVGDNVYVIHGQQHHVPYSRVDIFDLKSKSWSKVTDDEIVGRAGHTANLVDDLIYVFAGSSAMEFLNSVEVFHPGSRRWSKPSTSGKPPMPRDFHTAVTFGKSIYVYGGRSDVEAPWYTNNQVYPEDVKCFDTSTFAWSDVPVNCGPSPLGRRSHSAVAYRNKMVIFGGYNQLADRYFSDLMVFDVRERSWSTVLDIAGPAPNGRRRHGFCMADEKTLFIYGGTNQGLADGVEYDDDIADVYEDLSDSYVMSFEPTLKELCFLAVIQHRLDYSQVPMSLRLRLDVLSQEHVTV
eukprot:m.1005 g.1005  ORF g.1005 m.1005 type:complete len:374 (+) comp5438_c0_seq1:199-1320(+)